MEDYVCKNDFKEYQRANDQAHGDIMTIVKKLEPLADPELIKTLKESAELTNASRRLVSKYKNAATTAGIFLAVISACLLIIRQSRDLLIEFILKLK